MPSPLGTYKAVGIVVLLCIVACSKYDDPSLSPSYHKKNTPHLIITTTANPYRNVYFGDLHIHTGYSTDAFIMGVRSVPEDVYRFATGQAIEHAVGYPLQIKRPLDFAAVTDHAEYLGHARKAALNVPTTEQPLPEILTENLFSITLAWLKTTLTMKNKGWGIGYEAIDQEIYKHAWQDTIDAAEKYNQPGTFTTFVGYEWSASVGDITTHIHRVVIYGSDKVSDLPFSSLDSNNPSDLWHFLQQEEQQGNIAIAIPHNSNQSKGYMYATLDNRGQAIDEDYATLRNYYEPVSEILQIKGASETHPLLSNLDEFADYGMARMDPRNTPSINDVKGSYARDALRAGMALYHSEGFNPFKFGVIGASDSHNANSPSEESNYSGKLPMMDGSAGLRTSQSLLLPNRYNPAASWSSGGLAGVWAEENTRSALFKAIRRKETFATSGPRISLRMFGSWALPASMLDDTEIVSKAYQHAVPMGATLPTPPPNNLAPTFLLMASKDPEGANLDRLQIIKGWVDDNGKSHEKIYNVAVSDNRIISPKTGKVAAVKNTVDIKNASYKNTVGATQFITLWHDPDFDPSQFAFYYARVLEIPTPRWSTYDAVRLGIKPMPPETIQERAIGSAIWYEPDKRNNHK